jgi:hypothetical protein
MILNSNTRRKTEKIGYSDAKLESDADVLGY